jgi:F0F1-type ATP synthase membrane subunit b/b'
MASNSKVKPAQSTKNSLLDAQERAIKSAENLRKAQDALTKATANLADAKAEHDNAVINLNSEVDKLRSDITVKPIGL